jgi:glycosyltransferase involved in cell wall biosynthesis
MEVGFNALFLNNPGVGSGVYSSNLLKGLGQIDRKNRYRIFAPAKAMPLPSMLSANFSISRGFRLPEINRLINKILWEQTFCLRAAKAGLDVFHHPYFTSSFGLTTRTVVTIHDMAHRHFPAYLGGPWRRLYFRYLERAVKRADWIITDSRFSKLEIRRFLGLPDSRIAVIPLAAGPEFGPVVDRIFQEEIRSRYSLPEKFILYLGGFDIRKNVDNLIRAFALLEKERRAGYKLVLAGRLPSPPSSRASKTRLNPAPSPRRSVREWRLGNDVCFPGYISSEDLAAVYSLAALFVYPSLCEGFGLPLLEAMACGAPVVASSASSIPEIVDRTDLLFDPRDPEDMARKIEGMLFDRELGQTVGRWSLERAAMFSWPKAAQATLQVYEDACSNCSSKES